MTIVVTLPATRTLGDLKARVADELARADLTSQIALAIDDAIDEAATNRFWFNEARGLTFPTVIGQEYYTSDDISALNEIDGLWIVVNGQRRNLRPAGDGQIDGMREGNQSDGEPYLWSRYGTRLRFYPTPDKVYTVTLDGVSSLAPIGSDLNGNAWTDPKQGERLVRALAKRNLLAEVIRDFEEAKVQDGLAQRYREELLAQTHGRIATGRMACNG